MLKLVDKQRNLKKLLMNSITKNTNNLKLRIFKNIKINMMYIPLVVVSLFKIVKINSNSLKKVCSNLNNLKIWIWMLNLKVKIIIIIKKKKKKMCNNLNLMFLKVKVKVLFKKIKVEKFRKVKVHNLVKKNYYYFKIKINNYFNLFFIKKKKRNYELVK